MIQDMVLWTCSGGMKIVYLSQFAKMIKHAVVQQPIVDVAYGEVPERAFWDHEKNSEFVMPPVAAFKRETHELKPFYQIEADILARRSHESGIATHMMREQAQEKAFSRIEEEFKIMVAQRQPTFFMKDLSMENVEKLSEEYAKQMGNDACGVNISLSPYQKFFVIIDPNDLCFYQTMIQRHTISHAGPVTEFLGKLIDLRPDKWQMGRYEDLTYVKELSAMRMYQGPK